MALNSIQKNMELKQVRGWSVHSENKGILGPLFHDPEGKLFFLDAVDHLGFFKVSSQDKVYKDEPFVKGAF
jgi:hypothetical protein